MKMRNEQMCDEASRVKDKPQSPVGVEGLTGFTVQLFETLCSLKLFLRRGGGGNPIDSRMLYEFLEPQFQKQFFFWREWVAGCKAAPEYA